MKKFPATVFLLILPLFTMPAQDYETGLGVKIGMSPGISAKHFITTNGALEGIATVRHRGANFTALGEFHLPVFDTDGMSLYYGGGLHAGVWDTGLARNQGTSGRRFNMGIDGIIGLEHTFFYAPIAIGLDWKPYINLIRDRRLIIDELSFTIKFIFR